MTPIDKIMQEPAAKWVDLQIAHLPDKVKFRAASALRSLHWASRIYEIGLPIPASYFALHATEEAVAAFVSCAKEHGYGDDAKINLKDHMQKSVVSLLVQKVGNLLEKFNVAVAVHPGTGKISVRYLHEGKVAYAEASSDLINVVDHEGEFTPDFYDQIQNDLGDVEAIKKEVTRIQEGRNKILYASGKGLPTGFLEPEAQLRRECMLTLGLVWACIDIKEHGGEKIPFIKQALCTANIVIAELLSKKGNLNGRFVEGAG